MQIRRKRSDVVTLSLVIPKIADKFAAFGTDLAKIGTEAAQRAASEGYTGLDLKIERVNSPNSSDYHFMLSITMWKEECGDSV